VTPLSWSLPSQRDIARIARQLGDIDKTLAGQMITKIRASSWRLREFPLPAPQIGGSRLRKLVVTGAPYVLVYEVIDERVIIARVRHAHEDWSPR
jgi:plasmid stabilization system protein ParE